MKFYNIHLGNNRYIRSIKFSKISKQKWEKFKNTEVDYYEKIKQAKIIKSEDMTVTREAFKDWYQHMQHPAAIVELYDEKSKQYSEIVFNLTSKASDISIKPSIITIGNKPKNYKVIKISENLYITSHSLVTDINEVDHDPERRSIEYEELKYDTTKKYYVGAKQYENLTQENTEGIIEVIKQELQKENHEKVDMTSHIHSEDMFIASKLLELKSYEKSEQEYEAEVEYWSERLNKAKLISRKEE